MASAVFQKITDLESMVTDFCPLQTAHILQRTASRGRELSFFGVLLLGFVVLLCLGFLGDMLARVT